MQTSTKLLRAVSVVSLFLGSTMIIIGVIITSINQIAGIILLNFGSIILGAGIIGVFFDTITKNDLIERISGRVDHINKMDLEEFYENREDLPKINEILKDCEEVWCAWFTGGSMGFGGKINKFKNIKEKRLILTLPGSDSLNHFEKILQDEDLEEYNRQIKRCTKKAQKINMNVRWFDGPILYSILIINPKGAKGKKSFAQLELVIPFGDLDERPAIIVSPYRGKETYDKIIRWYKKIWSQSITPRLV